MADAEVPDNISCELSTKKRKVATGESSEVSFDTVTSDRQVTIMSKNGVGEIDEGLYSRQLYVLGHDAMRKMATSDVLISGLGGLGVEIAKNVILGGVKSVTLHDSVACAYSDLSAQFYLAESDIGKNRAEVSLPKLAELNSYVSVKAYTGILSESYVRQFNVVILTESSLDEQLRISDITHPNKIALIVADTRGVFSQVFCDFGEDFTVTDTTGENPISVLVASISKEEQGVLTCIDRSRHGFEDGDYVVFQEVQDMTEINNCEPKQITVLGPFTFSVGDATPFSDYRYGGIATQVKMPKKLNFKSLRESLVNPEFLTTDFAKYDRPSQLHLAFIALHKFVSINGRLPKPWSSDDASAFLKLTETANTNSIELDANLIKMFSKVCAGNINPMTAFIGGIVAQEVMKSCSGKFNPIFQWLYFDATESLPENVLEEDAKPIGNRYDGQVAIYGQKFQSILTDLKYFVVGAGAIGCELLKNFAVMGVGCGKGKIYVTDMDLIEKSNLNRQFLFRANDVQTSKSETAAKAIKCMNPFVNVEPQTNRVGIETEQTYNDTFFENLDGIANALDDVDARIYMDRRCVLYKKPLLESGTFGTKGNTQVVIPNLTESYSSSRDPQEKFTDVCTIECYPYAIEHTLEWAKSMFEELFKYTLESVQLCLDDPSVLECSCRFGRLEFMEIINSDLVKEYPKNFVDCIVWARMLFEEAFMNQIKRLLFQFPPDQTTSTGQQYWSGPKRCPKPIVFDVNNTLHLDFIFSAANLRAETYNISQIRDRVYIANVVSSVKVPEYILKSEKDSQITNKTSNSDHSKLNKVQKDLPSTDSLKNIKLVPLEFEKDDDSNLHIDFIVAASNLRAINYDFHPADRHRSKLIAGNIIPAIATTSSVVAGLVCQEFIKLILGFKELKKFKNGFVNLALPFFAFSEPLLAPKSKYYNTEWTLWDRFEVDGELTLGEFVNYFKDKYGLKITEINNERSRLYSSSKKELNITMSDIVCNASDERIGPHVKSLVFELCCDDANGRTVEVPYVKYNLPSDFQY